MKSTYNGKEREAECGGKCAKPQIEGKEKGKHPVADEQHTLAGKESVM